MNGDKTLKIQLLGPLSVSLSDGQAATFPTQKSKALFAMIALAGKNGIDRSVAASMLWSRGSEAQARANLRQTLASIRKALSDQDDVIISEGTSLRVNASLIQVDVDGLEAPRGRTPEIDIDTLGTLLEGIQVDEPRFSEWLEVERSALLRRMSVALFDMGETMLEAGALNDARKANQKLLSFDEFDEGAHRQTMRIYANMGAHAQALYHYEKLVDLLQSELGTSPSAPTQALMKSLRVSTEFTDELEASTLSIPKLQFNNRFRSEKTTITVGQFNDISDQNNVDIGAGLADDIAIELGRFSTLNVVRSESSTDNGSIPLAEIMTSYLVEGSVRYSGQRVRISIQLVDGTTRDVIWAERYDRLLVDSFDLQDDITRCVAAAVPGRVQTDVAERASRREIDALNAHELMLRGKALRDVLSADAMVEARTLLKRAVELDPQSARAHMYLSDTYILDAWLGLASKEDIELALSQARIAITADPSDVFVQDHLGFAFLINRMWTDGRKQIDRTLRNIGNEVESNAWCGYALSIMGDHEAALREVLKSTERDPIPPATFGWIKGQVYSFNGYFEESIEELMGASILNSMAQAFLVGGYARLGRMDDAKYALNDFIKMRADEFRSRNKPTPEGTVLELAGDFAQCGNANKIGNTSRLG